MCYRFFPLFYWIISSASFFLRLFSRFFSAFSFSAFFFLRFFVCFLPSFWIGKIEHMLHAFCQPKSDAWQKKREYFLRNFLLEIVLETDLFLNRAVHTRFLLSFFLEISFAWPEETVYEKLFSFLFFFFFLLLPAVIKFPPHSLNRTITKMGCNVNVRIWRKYDEVGFGRDSENWKKRRNETKKKNMRDNANEIYSFYTPFQVFFPKFLSLNTIITCLHVLFWKV